MYLAPSPIEPLGALIVATCVGLMASWGFHHLTRGRIARWGEARKHHEGLRIQRLQEGLSGAKDVKLLGRETEFLRAVPSAQCARRSCSRGHMYTLQQLPRLWLELLAVSGLALLVLSDAGTGPCAAKPCCLTLGLFAAAAFRLMPSVNRLLAAVQSLRYGCR